MKRVFKYPSIVESEGMMYSDVKGFLAEAGLNPKLVFNIILSVSEAFTNALEHGNKFMANKQIKVAIDINDRIVIADITDEGEGYSNESAADRLRNPTDEGGRGIGLMKAFADDINYLIDDRTGGTRVSMRFSRENYQKIKGVAGNLEDKMEVKKREEGQIAVLQLSGRLDLGNGNKLKEEVKGILNSGKVCIHLNLKGVEFVNSSGLGALVSIMKETRIHRGRLTLSDMADYVREIFDITQLSHIFEIFATEQEALHSYHPMTVA